MKRLSAKYLFVWLWFAPHEFRWPMLRSLWSEARLYGRWWPSYDDAERCGDSLYLSMCNFRQSLTQSERDKLDQRLGAEHLAYMLNGARRALARIGIPNGTSPTDRR